mmetsp:Transcript_20181/g.48070  ORF Transcript_20181/g.48070 Transcript_20181/m.48070 type:complete len:200 (-) Transcript_20181:548-1147(-)
MTCLMVSHKLLLGLTHDCAILFWPCNNSLECISNFLLAYLLQIAPGSHDCSFIHQILQISTCKSWSASCYFLIVDILPNCFTTGMNFQDLDSALDIWSVHCHLPIKPTRSKECLIQYIRPVRSCNHNDTSVAFKSIHFGEKLIDSLFSFIIAASHASASLSANSIYLINKHNARSFRLRLLKQIANTRGTNTNKKLHKL